MVGLIICFRFDSLSDQFKDTKLVQPTYVYDNTTTKQCNDMFERLESNPATRLFWRMMKPFVRLDCAID